MITLINNYTNTLHSPITELVQNNRSNKTAANILNIEVWLAILS